MIIQQAVRVLVPGLLALVIAAAAQAGPAPAKIGVNAAIRKSIQVKTLADVQYRPAVLRQPVHLGDALVSGPDSALQILLLDRTVFSLGSNTRMTLDRFVYDPTRNSSDVAASVARGSLRFMSGRSLSGNGRNAISSPVASIGVRGTMVEMAVGQDVADILAGDPILSARSRNLTDATLIVLRGPGVGTTGSDKPGAIDVTLRAQPQIIQIEASGVQVRIPIAYASAPAALQQGFAR